MKVTLNSIAQEDAGALMCCFDAERTADGLSHGIAAADGLQRSENCGRVSFVMTSGRSCAHRHTQQNNHVRCEGEGARLVMYQRKLRCELDFETWHGHGRAVWRRMLSLPLPRRRARESVRTWPPH